MHVVSMPRRPTSSQDGAARPLRALGGRYEDTANAAARLRERVALRRCEIVLSVLWAVAAGLLVARFWGHAADDFFITYRYAWNLAHGQGLVFNPGEHVFGLSNPGLALLLAALYRLSGVDIHLLGTIVFGLALWALASVLLASARGAGEKAVAAVGGTLVVGSTALWINHGSEAVPALLLLVVAAVVGERRPVLAGLLAGMAVWLRPDAALGVALLVLLLWADRRRVPWRLLATASCVIGLGAGLAWVYFGTALPATLEAKRLMAQSRPGAFSGPIRFWLRGAHVLARHWGAGLPLVTGLGIAGLWPLAARSRRPLRLVAVYGLATAIAYPLLGVPFFPWYAVVPVIAVLYGLAAFAVAIGKGTAVRFLPVYRRTARGVAAGLVAVLVLALPIASMLSVGIPWLLRFEGYGRYQTYRLAAEWVRQHSASTDRLAYGEIGTLAYFSQRPVDDLLGLTTPRSLPFVRTGDGAGAFLAGPPTFFFEHPQGPHRGIVTQPWFEKAYELVATIPPAPGETGVMKIYRRRKGVPLPPARGPRAQRVVSPGAQSTAKPP